jgi:hypothetical protein
MTIPPSLPDRGRDIKAEGRQYRTPGLDHAVRTAERFNDDRTANSTRRMMEAGGRMSPPPGHYRRKKRSLGNR